MALCWRIDEPEVDRVFPTGTVFNVARVTVFPAQCEHGQHQTKHGAAQQILLTFTYSWAHAVSTPMHNRRVVRVLAVGAERARGAETGLLPIVEPARTAVSAGGGRGAAAGG